MGRKPQMSKQSILLINLSRASGQPLECMCMYRGRQRQSYQEPKCETQNNFLTQNKIEGMAVKSQRSIKSTEVRTDTNAKSVTKVK